MTDTESTGPPRRPQLPERGWLPDPSRMDIERYWDGVSWTGRIRDRASGLEYIPDTGWLGEPRRRRYAGRWFASLSVIVILAVAGVGYAGALPSWMPASIQVSFGKPAGPDVAYPVFGSDETVTYLARSLIAQEQSIDMTYLQVSGGDVSAKVQDAMKETLAQNPYVFVSAWRVSIGTLGVRVMPQYVYSDTEAERRRVATASAVEAIVSLPAIQAEMDPRAKVQALHDAVLTSATYDFTAYEEINDGATTETSMQVAQSQEAYGILVAGTAVCTGYAQAFQLLAQASGMRAVVVTGRASSGFTTGGHAWNRVMVNGRWLVVDTTWNDADDARLGRDYLLLDPSDARLATRTADTGWVVDANAGMYR